MKYSTKSEFRLSDSGAYSAANRQGVLNEICSHMITKNYSTPQLILKNILDQLFNSECLYNDRKIIPPLELDIFYPKYNIAFEYNGNRWHINNKNDILKNKLCKNKNIYLITLKENNRKFKEDIMRQLCDNVKIINKITGLNISENDINEINISNYSNNVLDEKFIKEVISKYSKLKDFMRCEGVIYRKLVRLKKLDLLSVLERDRKKYNEKVLIEEVNKYKNLLDFIKNSKRFYTYIHKHNLRHLLVGLKKR